MYKLLRELPKIDIQVDRKNELPVKHVGISLWEPDESHKFIPTPPPQCAVCGNVEFEEGERLSALLNPEFFAFGYVIRVWVHAACFENCIETGEPEPVPW